ncbi:diguanylate cyclase (GGDEF) domain-containing protein [Novosphingobium sp. CF614]|uniref:GGDEF domain-containing protein n=1 Tax=Novosphingobium sp. CF614 TaxID=1884364 RepID=UPI0008EF78C5|nr:GGDEF domain-containing protein [Novosphingobium sp. CF614]SFG15007.1 diguanylate cyclase (GGDEF) domain-containing protein [Novosphingobium sp. CF614]
MTSRRPTERRQAKHVALTLEHSFLFHIPPRIALAVIVALLCAVATIEHFVPREIWFGPVYLGVLALAAWSRSTGTAVAIGLFVLVLKLVTGNLAFYPGDAGLVVPNLVVRIAGIMVVMAFIGMARKSCEKEWRFARTDLLTGALNRQAFFEIVRGDQRLGGWSAIIYADLDGLKRLNDEEGHDQGDQCLKIFAQTVRNTIRKGDVLARMGGDEFVIFMKLKDQEAGATVARRLHKALNADVVENCCRLKCSLGVLLLPEGSKSIDVELRAADELMYKAKKSQSGVLVSTAFEYDGKLALLPSTLIFAPSGHESAVRKADRAAAAGAIPPGRALPKPESPIAA